MIKLQVRKSGVSDGRAWFTVGSWPAELFASVVAPLYPCGTVGDFVSLIKADGTPVPTAPAAGVPAGPAGALSPQKLLLI